MEAFGLSPYGDNDLLDKLNEMEMVTMYVYDKNNNEQVDDWNRCLIGRHAIKDTREIL